MDDSKKETTIPIEAVGEALGLSRNGACDAVKREAGMDAIEKASSIILGTGRFQIVKYTGP